MGDSDRLATVFGSTLFEHQAALNRDAVADFEDFELRNPHIVTDHVPRRLATRVADADVDRAARQPVIRKQIAFWL